MFGKMANRALDWQSDATRNEINYVKKVFRQADPVIIWRKEKETATDEAGVKKYESYINMDIEKMGWPLSHLYEYEVTAESFEKYAPSPEYAEIIKKGCEVNADLINDRFMKSWFRLKETKPSLRKAKKNFEECVEAFSKCDPLVLRIFASKAVKQTNEEYVRIFNNWLAKDFDALIDEIEPVRQEYIISRKGDVKREEVEQFLTEKFDIYETYAMYLIGRRNIDISYYPDLKI